LCRVKRDLKYHVLRFAQKTLSRLYTLIEKTGGTLMKKIVVKVCLGTSCYVMGSSYLQELVDIIPLKFGNSVSVIGHNCMGECVSKGVESNPPYVQINGEIVSGATIEKVLEYIEKIL
jgi:NADH:ubiquinone oxidoreductase subunit E